NITIKLNSPNNAPSRKPLIPSQQNTNAPITINPSSTIVPIKYKDIFTDTHIFTSCMCLLRIKSPKAKSEYQHTLIRKTVKTASQTDHQFILDKISAIPISDISFGLKIFHPDKYQTTR